jgi:hypothetical protein
MRTETVDDRSEEQKKTHYMAVGGRDKFLSRWRGAKGGTSRAAWAVHPDVDINGVFSWVNRRQEMAYVNAIDLRTYRPPSGTAHFHIYVIDPGHPADNKKHLR